MPLKRDAEPLSRDMEHDDCDYPFRRLNAYGPCTRSWIGAVAMTRTNGVQALIRATLIGVILLVASSIVGQVTEVQRAAAASLGAGLRNRHTIPSPIALSV